jgi:hypothetical protein
MKMKFTRRKNLYKIKKNKKSLNFSGFNKIEKKNHMFEGGFSFLDNILLNDVLLENHEYNALRKPILALPGISICFI